MSQSPSKVLRRGDLTHFSASMAAAAIGLLSTLVAARYLLPADLGTVQTVMMIGTYFAYVDLGVSSGLQRMLPQFLGQGQHEEARLHACAAWAVTRWVVALGVGISALTSAYGWVTGKGAFFQFAVLGLLTLLTAGTVETFLALVFRGCQQFADLGLRLHWKNLGTVVLSLLPVVAGRSGMIVRNILLPLLGWGLLHPRQPLELEARVDWPRIRVLARTGLPIVVLYMISSYLSVADRSLVAVFLGPEAVGHFSLAALLLAGFQVLPSSLGAILYPRAAEALARRPSSDSLRGILLVSVLFNLGALIPVALASYAWIEPAIHHLLPRYEPGAAAARITCLGAPFLGYVGVGNILVVLRRSHHLSAILLLGWLASWGIGSRLLTSGAGIEALAWMRVGVNGCVFVSITAYAAWLVSRKSPVSP